MPATRWGVTLPFQGIPLRETEPLVRAVEAAGYDDLWTGETNGPDGFTPLALAAAWTDRLRLGTGVVNAYTRGVPVLAQHAAALQDASGGRFALGIGSSSNVIVERWNGIPFRKPLTRVRETVEALRPILAGGRGPGGFKLEAPPAERVPILVAALRDRMLRLAGEIGDGAWVNFLPLSAAEHVVARVREGEATAGKAPGSGEVVCRFFCVPGPPEVATGVSRFLFSAYATVPVYEAFFRQLGHGEAIDPLVSAWREGDRRAALEAAPDDLIRDIVLVGTPEEMRERLGRFVAAGITTPVLTPLAAPADVPGLIAALAPR